MVLCFDLSAQAHLALEELIKTGQFQNMSEAASMALVNYQVIHQAVSKGDAIGSKSAAPSETPRKTSLSVMATEADVSTSKIPELLRLENAALDGLDLPEIPDAEPIEIPPARWLFGQYNKLLPVKASCRGLLNMLRESPGGVPLAEATEKISTEAWVLGDYLYALDQGSDRSREGAFAAAFPTTLGNGARSRLRFANQFVGDVRQPKKTEDQADEVKFTGLPSALKFIFCTDNKNPVLSLSKPGAEFANLRNPIFDAGAATPDRKFSETEIEFMLAHLQRAVPEEISAYRAIIDAITEGENTPDAVDQYLCHRFHLEIAVRAEEENQITQTFLTTQRTGAISRMVDLGLLGREKSGLHVSYVVAHSGGYFRAAKSQGRNKSLPLTEKT